MTANINKELIVLIVSVSVMFMAVMLVLANNISSSDRNFDAILEGERELHNQTQVLNTLLTGRTTLFTQLQNSTDEILEKIESEQPQSNFTAQREAVKNIEDIKDDINRIQGSVLSLDNKVNELFFLENKTPIRPAPNTTNIG